ncbi:cobalamin biosynthesis protein CobY [Salinadaptatus halalkaliphilus]|uniref:Cobalamin biosynthesis protein CobY n=1 Tax=Salinadaptatus halalkaliphilus TaxID=2419781 RepID=A0A4S3TMR3_9EURY|nr:NTP transferase domain-containing protein [Salinadaptatus halalkaliphilus]THE65564.1 cobalamin biosynthesis protein CobY [Salinadaptatus halalkaliphilus]
MCGGEGTRLESHHEKPLHPIDGVPMVDCVLAALADSRVETIYAAVSPNAPETRAYLEGSDDGIDDSLPGSPTPVETAGEGYVADLLALLERPALSAPIVTVAADLPLLEPAVIDRLLAAHGDSAASRTVCVPVSLKRRLAVSVDSTLESHDYLAPTGVNVVGNSAQSMHHVSYDPRLAVNVNRRTDARTAANHLRRTDQGVARRDGTSGEAHGQRRGGDDPCA